MSFDHPERRTVSASDAPPIGRSGSPFDVLAKFHGDAEPQEDKTIVVRAGRRPKNGGKTHTPSARFQVACVLLAAGDESVEREAIAGQLDGVPDKALSNALFNMKTAGHAEKADGGWRLTDAGRGWVNGGANLMNQRATADTIKPKPGPRAIARTPLPAAQIVPVRPSFRCWLASDCTFAMEKAGQRVELTLEETRQMLRYLDAVGEQLVASAA